MVVFINIWCWFSLCSACLWHFPGQTRITLHKWERVHLYHLHSFPTDTHFLNSKLRLEMARSAPTLSARTAQGSRRARGTSTEEKSDIEGECKAARQWPEGTPWAGAWRWNGDLTKPLKGRDKRFPQRSALLAAPWGCKAAQLRLCIDTEALPFMSSHKHTIF